MAGNLVCQPSCQPKLLTFHYRFLPKRVTDKRTIIGGKFIKYSFMKFVSNAAFINRWAFFPSNTENGVFELCMIPEASGLYARCLSLSEGKVSFPWAHNCDGAVEVLGSALWFIDDSFSFPGTESNRHLYFFQMRFLNIWMINTSCEMIANNELKF